MGQKWFYVATRWVKVARDGSRWNPGRKGRCAVDVDFMGTYTPRLDDKGRLAIPARFREDFGSGLVMTRGPEGCVYLFPTAQFRAVSAAMAQVPSSAAAVRARIRIFRSSATPPEAPDRQGRVTVPVALRGYAEVARDAYLIGNGNRLELWNPQRWEDYLAAHADDYANYSPGDEEVVIPGL